MKLVQAASQMSKPLQAALYGVYGGDPQTLQAQLAMLQQCFTNGGFGAEFSQQKINFDCRLQKNLHIKIPRNLDSEASLLAAAQVDQEGESDSSDDDSMENNSTESKPTEAVKIEN